MRRVRSEHGVTLMEVTTMLVVTVAIIGALAPTLSAVVRRAEQAAAVAAMTKIATQIPVMLTDIAFTAFKVNGLSSGTTVNMLVTDGDTQPASITDDNGAAPGVQMRWDDPVNNTTGLVDFLERHMVFNMPRGNAANAYSTTEVVADVFWQGAYLTAPTDPDPWGNRYAVNVQWLGPSTNDVVVFSSGPDEQIDSLFQATSLSASDDDIIVLVEP